MTQQEQSAVCERFALGEPQSCEPLDGTRNHNFRLTTSRGQFVIRDRYVGYRDPSRITFDHAASHFLSVTGAPVVSPVPTMTQESFWATGERLWEVFPAVPGQHFRDGNLDDIRALAAAMAKFHGVGSRFTSSCDKLGPRGETDPAQMRQLIDQLRKDAGESLIDL